MTAFKRFVEVGRVVLLSNGRKAGRIAVIVDIVDHHRVIVEGPTTGVHRHVASLSQVTLTDISIKDLPRTIGTAALKKAIVKSGVVESWKKTSWAKKLEVRRIRANLTDYDRFKVMRLKKQKRFIVDRQLAAVRKTQSA
ncbi:hypothetical protein BB560_001126 [Smittium megazygosporum]|uniref:Large ribosomal subunit protein eL14 domain-containing protein n=1 Tax=Smittium megazygosporum TaxID=133381 RepID=A0A2T9ZIG6_9FUNG|nr:hypothetical protein BB560_001126 [Smittium megazygosporum]